MKQSLPTISAMTITRAGADATLYGGSLKGRQIDSLIDRQDNNVVGDR
jgi:hypothetical protein